jgi:hypothetical protein
MKSFKVRRLGCFTVLFLGCCLMAQAQSWTYTGSMVFRHAFHTATLLENGNVLVAGGDYKGHYGIANSELYNPSTGTFSTTGSLNTGRQSHTATLLNNGQVLIAGGEANVYSPTGSHIVCLTTAELYNPSTGTFTYTGSMTTARCANFTATRMNNGTVLFTGGYNNGVIASAEVYEPSTGTFSATGNLQVGRTAQTATLLENGDVLIAGGTNGTNFFNSAELYNPSSGSFAFTGSMKAARGSFTGTLLPGGDVLAAAGTNSPYGSTRLTSAELDNSSTGKWTSTGSLNYGRFGQTGTLLQDGQVLIAAGSFSQVSELYNPSSGTFSPFPSKTPRRCC